MKKKIGKRMTAWMLAAMVGISSLAVPTEQEARAGEMTAVEVKSWDFSKDANGWYDGGSGWDWQYHGRDNTSVSYDAETQRLKVDVDYSADTEYDWSQMAVCYYEDGMSLTGANQVALDVYYDKANQTMGGFSIKAYSNSGVDANVALEESAEEVVDGTLVKVPVVITFDVITNDVTPDFSLCIIGRNTDYKGTVWFDNVVISRLEDTTDKSVDATIVAGAGNQVMANASELVTTDKTGAQEKTAFESGAKMVDGNADDNTVAVYEYLEAMGKTSSVIYGHQNDTWYKAGSSSLSFSDTFDVTGQYAGIVGIDTLSLTGNEYSASRYNNEIAAKDEEVQAIDVETLGKAKANVVAAARLTNQNIANGSIITLSAHMPNFSIVNENAEYKEGEPSYAKYDFSGYTPNVLTGDVANEILPGGKYNEMYCAYLDMIADYASMVDGTILFRPFHEGTGSWFWWGAAFCNEETFKNIYRYTVTYLRDTKEVHNMIYVYGPGSEASSEEEYEARYPGDAYVDMVGFDMYNSEPTADNTTFLQNFKNELGIVQNFARNHGKLMAVTETGVSTASPDAEENQTALHSTGNADKDWYMQILEAVSETDASYFLLWANFGKRDGYYTPYVDVVKEDGTLRGHEMLDSFLEFYNDNRSVFAGDQKEVLSSLTETLSGIIGTAGAVGEDVTGYILAPIAGKRILSETELAAQILGCQNEKVSFVLKGTTTKEVKAEVKDGVAQAVLTNTVLQELGSCADGSISLVIDGKVQQKIAVIFNIEEPEEDLYEIDGFESYYGVDTLLTKKWSTNKDNGCSISLHLITDEELVYEGDYALQFSYQETSTGWAGATISKEVDWSDCNAIQFYTIPDGKNQKTVVQLTANGIVYETYLNLYEEYAADTDGTPLLVTIPFADFVQRDTAGNPKGGLLQDCGKVTSFGLWVNAIGDSEAVVDGMVSGTLIYDKVTAVHTESQSAVFEKNPVKNSDNDNGNSDADNGNDSGETGSDDNGTGNETGSDSNNGGSSGADSGNSSENGTGSNAGNDSSVGNSVTGSVSENNSTVANGTEESVYQTASGEKMRKLKNGMFAIDGTANLLPEGAVITADYLTGGSIFERAVVAIQTNLPDCQQYKVFEINLYDKNQTEIHQLDGYVKVSLPIPENFKVSEGKTIVVYRLGEDGTLTECEATEENGILTFSTNHFSTFILAEKEAVVPQTGDAGIPLLPVFFLGIGSLCLCVVVKKKQKLN
ncbi:MAG: glycosyl hydrolase [Roseburia sp.]